MIKIIADTTCGLPRDLLNQHGIYFLPQIVIFGDESYRDDTEIDSKTFLVKLRAAAALPKTAAPPPALYYPIFNELRDSHDTAIIITPSAEVSGTFRSAVTAAKEYTDVDIRVVDSRTVAGGLGQLILRASEWVNQGAEIDALETRIKEMAKREHVYFVVDTLEYLFKGGRIGGAQALLGSFLQIKPILTLNDGRIQPVEKQRTKRRALHRLQEIVIAACPHGKESFISIAHVEAENEAAELVLYFKKALGVEDIPIYEAPPAIVVHGGPKILAVSFFSSPN
jgi:DegV family protein with EDD domain